MVDQKITALTADTAPSSTDLLKTVKDPAGTPLDRKATLLDVFKGAALGLLTADNDIIARVSGAATRIPVAASRIVGRKASGDVVALTGAEAGDLIGVYQSYTPTLAQNGTRTTSAALGRYCQIGKHVHCWGKVTCSAAGSAGSAISISLPVSISASAAAEQILGAGWVQDLGTIWMPAVCAYFGSDTIAFIKTNADVENWIGAAPSYALASGDIINWNITYEAA